MVDGSWSVVGAECRSLVGAWYLKRASRPASVGVWCCVQRVYCTVCRCCLSE